jgi:heterodisulfide reductase subunit C
LNTPSTSARPGPLRVIVLASTGQDVRKCWHCEACNTNLAPDQDVTLETLLQMVVMNDEEALTSHTLWSDTVLASAPHVCSNGLDVEAIMLALRLEAHRRGLQLPITHYQSTGASE